LRPAQANSFQGLIFKITRTKCTGNVTQAIEHLLCKREAVSSNPSSTKKKSHYLTVPTILNFREQGWTIWKDFIHLTTLGNYIKRGEGMLKNLSCKMVKEKSL
jgi:hypothetical protein